MGPTSKGREKAGRGGKGRKGRGREEGEEKGGEGKGMEGKNVLPHVKQAVAAYGGAQGQLSPMHLPSLRHVLNCARHFFCDGSPLQWRAVTHSLGQ